MNDSSMTAATDMPLDERFGFGKNWKSYIQLLDEPRIQRAEETLKQMLDRSSLERLTFLDIGCGSGLFSLAAKRLGAKVTSVDFDPNSVECAKTLKSKWSSEDDETWTIRQGSVLDTEMMRGLGEFDIVYSWGVLHHTGHMWDAIDNAQRTVRDGGEFFIAIYNDQGSTTRKWLRKKIRYNASSNFVKKLMVYQCIAHYWKYDFLLDAVKHGDPLHSWRNYQSERGMDAYHDAVDWMGGYPFEAATPEAIFEFCKNRGFQLSRMKTCGAGHGCNEFVFRKVD